MSRGHKHIVKCKCILQQHKTQKEPQFYAFKVFSVVSDEDVVEVSYAQCPNCGVIHKVTDICVSEIVSREEMKSLETIDEIKSSLPEKLLRALASTEKDIDIATWQDIKFTLDNQDFGKNIILTITRESGDVVYKFLTIFSETLFRVQTKVSKEYS